MIKTLTSILALIVIQTTSVFSQVVPEYESLEVCSGVTTQIGIDPLPQHTYQWPLISAISSPTTATTFFTVESGSPDPYDMNVTLREFDLSGTMTRLIAYTITINPRLYESTVITQAEICTGDTVFVEREDWWPAQIFVSPQTYITFDLVDSVYAIRPPDSSQYYFIYLDTMACTQHSLIAEINVHERPVVSVSSPEEVYCKTDTLLYQFEFSPDSAGGLFFGAGINQQGIFNPQLSPSGLRYVIYTVANAGCSATDTTFFYVFGEADVVLNELPNLCTSDDAIGLDYAEPPGGVYSIDGIEVDSLRPWLLDPGQHTVSYFIEIGQSCSVNVDGIFNIIPSPATPTISFSPDTIVCIGDTVTLTCSNFSHYLWSTGDTTKTIRVSESATPSVRVISNLGCYSYSAGIEIIVAPLISGMIGLSEYPSGFPISEFGAADGSATLELAGGYEPYMTSWSTGATDTLIIAQLDTGWYYVSVIDRAGCTFSDSVYLEQPDEVIIPEPTAPFSLPNAFTPNGDGFNDLYAINGLKGDLLVNSFRVWDISRRLVFEAENYNNTWDGHDMEGRKLPAGTYFAVFISEPADKEVKTYIDLRYE
ncbi:MAG: gliding motility-associated C-terminal domain-containing protein [Bacteroidia bacterium]